MIDNHSTSWAAIAIVFAIGYGVGAATMALVLLAGAWLRKWGDEG